MGGAYSMYGGRGEEHTSFEGGKLKGRDQLEDLGIEGRTVLKYIFKKCHWGRGPD